MQNHRHYARMANKLVRSLCGESIKNGEVISLDLEDGRVLKITVKIEESRLAPLIHFPKVPRSHHPESPVRFPREDATY